MDIEPTVGFSSRKIGVVSVSVLQEELASDRRQSSDSLSTLSSTGTSDDSRKMNRLTKVLFAD